MKTLEKTLKNAKGEAFLSLLKEASKPVADGGYIKEISDVHSWLCSKYARYIRNSLKKPVLKEIFVEAYEENYLK